ncbi:SAM-dependent methyltransferase [Iamia majanohamensis]|uniref:SAM-dependent methyltransferase n=1 Tax=Iamia majanohamensis TaxID=467976 RepID=A0AAE9Y5D3_9ACTN|nr:SAM-dependent methyltransferase [Iamia majanohamensis]WCO66705.1 SAM-dependent methyltransferase [Iamia majanohamensis]
MSADGAAPFSAFLEGALYDPDHGFYETGGRAGRRGDFVTSPEVGPLFGACLARALDGWWEDLGRPAPFLVDEHGAGPGTLARTVVVAAPACVPALRWTLVERSAAQRDLHPAHLPHVGDLAGDGTSAEPGWAAVGGGPLVASAAARPDRAAHVVVANELLDNLPFDLLERTADGWSEVRVAGAGGPAPTEVLAAAPEGAATWADAAAPDAPPGARIPLQRRAGEWVAASLAQLAPGGRLVVLDYASTTAALAARSPEEWIRTYAGQARGGAPLDAPGAQDVTVEVCTDQLAAAARPPDLDRDQAVALRAWGLDDLVEEGRRLWAERASAPDVAALRARSRVTEAEALTDPVGLGAFRVLEWQA